MVNQACLNIISINSILRVKFSLKCLKVSILWTNLKICLTSSQNKLRQTTEQNHICQIYLTLACKSLCNQPTTGLLNA